MEARTFIAGRFVEPARPTGEIVRHDPGALGRIASRAAFSAEAVDDAVAAASAAYPRWAQAPIGFRLALLRKFASLAKKEKERIARAISLEIGKPLWESREEAAALAEKVDITIKRSLPLVRPFHGGRGGCHFHPRGVMAVIGPFNMPLHLPNGHIIPALATGNTVVFKPSELAPGSATLYARLMQRAGIPPGVFNLVQGDASVGKLLAAHEAVNGVLFTGSYRAGLWIERMASHQPFKITALELGGKNAAVVFPDADMKHAVWQCALGAFMTTGQRCTATSRIMVHSTILRQFLERFVNLALRLAIGHCLEPGVFMGPLASEKALRRFEKAARQARAAGAQVLLASRRPKTRHEGYYVTASVHLLSPRAQAHPYMREEIFGPDVAVVPFDDVDEAIRLVNQSDYGLALSVFTRRSSVFNEFFWRCRVGVLNLNRATIGASSELPFGGQGKSGNDRPAALYSPLYCTYPVATLFGSPSRASYPPGFPRLTDCAKPPVRQGG